MDLFNKAKSEVEKMKEEVGIPLSISSYMLNEIIKKTDKIKETKVRIARGYIIITGKAEIEKMFIKKEISFLIKLKPILMKNREIQFEIIKFKPINLNFLNSYIFNQSPHIHYQHMNIFIDFNSWDIVKKVPIGNIKKYELKEGEIIITLGI
ncbi:hypothetical protein [Rossellomorea aquimaris]|uniref:hypothetical protein n=1 Tax=Rossellomorea aquimaris TaxID=189382 RepID=UPI0007D0B29E|nr:hypothetical protein [Rossellomorea aquimaris]